MHISRVKLHESWWHVHSDDTCLQACQRAMLLTGIDSAMLVPTADRGTTSSTFSDERHPCSLVSKVGCLLSFQKDEEKWAKCFFISIERCSSPLPTFFFLLPLRWSVCQILETECWFLINKLLHDWVARLIFSATVTRPTCTLMFSRKHAVQDRDKNEDATDNVKLIKFILWK